MTGYALAIFVSALVLGIIWNTYYTFVTKEIKAARAERINKLIRIINYIDNLSQRISLIPTTNSLYRILYNRQIALLEEIAKESPNNTYLNEKMPVIQGKMDTLDNADMLNETYQKLSFSIPTSEQEASAVTNTIHSTLKFLARERKFIDSQFVAVHKEKERLFVMMVQLKCEMLYKKSVKAAASEKRGEEVFHLEKGIEILIDTNIESSVLTSLETKLKTALEEAKCKKEEVHEDLEQKPYDNGLDKVTSYEKSRWY